MKLAIRKHWLDFVAIIGLIVISGAVSVYILDNQRLKLPAWVPVVGKDFFVVKAEMSTAQAVTPGQGQTVNIAGVQVGEISKVELKEGKALVTLRMEPRYGRVYKDATVLLRPKTGLKDMVAELEPGTPARGPPQGRRRHPGQPDAARRQPRRDARRARRRHARLPDRAASAPAPRACAATAARWRARSAASSPPPATAAEVFGALAERKQNIKRVIHNLSLIMEELGAKDDQVAEFVENSNAVFDTLAEPGREPALDADRAAVDAPGDPARARQGQDARRRARPDAAGAAAGRAGARPDAAAGAPVRARDDAGPARRDPAVRARLAPDGARAAARDARPRRRDARPDGARSRSSTTCSTRWPTTRRARRRATCSGSPGPTTSATSSSRPRTRTARSAAASSSPPARTCRCSTRSRSPTRCSAC